MKTLIAGLGSIGRRHFRNLISLGEKDIVLLRSHHATLPDEELAGYPVATDLHEALRKYKPEAVIVANPTALHLDVAMASARAGCSILMEKPVSDSLAHIDQLEAELQKGGGRLLVGFQFRFHPTLQKAARLLEDHAIGKPLSFHVHWGEYLPNWHPWEDFRRGYAARSDLGGGVTLTLSHPLDYIGLLVGGVDSLWAFMSASNLGLAVEDAVEIGLKMKTGAVGSVHLDYNQQPPDHRWEIVGSDGTMKWDNTSGVLEVYSAEKKAWEAHQPPAGFERNAMFIAEMRHFIAVVQKKEEPICTLEDGRQALRLALAAHESERKGILVKLS
ncbi:MAG TPA: Gfo/Idh/MocA family oxidoreductase [Anaerolineales bacterium]|nr:Gfo/Idh/MocA family oxidoreductase [Anaerolineales bacterium]